MLWRRCSQKWPAALRPCLPPASLRLPPRPWPATRASSSGLRSSSQHSACVATHTQPIPLDMSLSLSPPSRPFTLFSDAALASSAGGREGLPRCPQQHQNWRSDGGHGLRWHARHQGPRHRLARIAYRVPSLRVFRPSLVGTLLTSGAPAETSVLDADEGIRYRGYTLPECQVVRCVPLGPLCPRPPPAALRRAPAEKEGNVVWFGVYCVCAHPLAL